MLASNCIRVLFAVLLTSAGGACSDPKSAGMAAGGGGAGVGSGGGERDAATPRPDAGPGSTAYRDAGAVDQPTVPADLLDLTDWKLTLPIAADDQSDRPREVLQPELARFSLDPHFHLTTARDGVVFRAHAGGITTNNSGYPRSELREMRAEGSEEADWSTTEGTHTLLLTQAITHLPVAKPHVVAGQIHGEDSDLIMIRLEGEYLFVEGDGEDLGELDAAYALGTRFTVKIVASAGRISVFYQDLTAPKVELEADAVGCYFKAGAYTQSNPEHGDAADAYGEVIVYDLQLTHQ